MTTFEIRSQLTLNNCPHLIALMDIYSRRLKATDTSQYKN